MKIANLLDGIERRDIREYAVGTLFFVVSLVALRVHVLSTAGIGGSASVRLGLLTGIILDTAVAAFAVGAILVGGAALRGRSIFIAIAVLGVLWVAVLANALFFNFFGSYLPLTTVVGEGTEITGVWKIVVELMVKPWVGVSFLFILLALWMFRRADQGGAGPRLGRRRFSMLVLGLGMLPASLLFRQTIVWGRLNQNYLSPAAMQVAVLWWMNRGTLAVKPMTEEQVQEARVSLARFRGLREIGGAGESDLDVDPESLPAPGTFEKYVGLSAKEVAEARKLAGIELSDERPNVVFIFLESTRYFEMAHPDIWPEVLSETRRVIESHGIWYTQAYSSGFNTNRGMFSTMCSSFPNFLGASEVEIRPGVKASCLPQLLKDRGYKTQYVSGLQGDWGNVSTFLLLHGISEVIDDGYFKSLGFKQQVTDWGIDDGPLLKESVNLLERANKEGKPAFQMVMTMSPHPPYHTLPMIELSPKLTAKVAARKNYHGYLKRVAYLDRSLGEYFRKLFASPAGDHTIVVLVGDQIYSGVNSTFAQDPLSKLEHTWRIPMAIVSKRLMTPRVVSTPSHQVDLVPTVASLVGVQGKTAWLGRDLLKEEGSPFVYRYESKFYFRRGRVLCYEFGPAREERCFEGPPGADPLFQPAEWKRAARRPKVAHFFEKLSVQGPSLLLQNALME